MLTLLRSSKTHQNALLKVLNDVCMSSNILIGKLDCLMNNIIADNCISFIEEKIPLGVRVAIKPYISPHCKSCILTKAVIDNGSALDFMPLATLNKLLLDVSHIKHSHTVV